MGDLLGQLDVGHGVEADLVAGGRLPLGHLAQLAAVDLVPLPLAQEFLAHGGRRVDDDFAVGAVDDQHVAGADALADVVQPDHGRDAHGAGQDGGVRGRAAHVHGHGQDVALAEAHGRLGRQQVVGHQDGRPVRAALGRIPGLARGEIAVNLGHDVGDVGLALAHGLVGQGVEDAGIVVVDRGQGALGRDPSLADAALDPRGQGRVGQDEQVGVEDEGMLLADLGPDGVADERSARSRVRSEASR